MDWISPAIGAAGGIIQGIFGAGNSKRNLKAQADANATNLQINRENNAANLKLAQQQNDWNLAQWHREMAYNTPASQMGRYTSAGINPYTAMNQVTNGNASSNLTSANLANQTPASVSPVMGMSPAAAFMDSATSGFVTLAQTLASLKKTDNESKLISANTIGQNIHNKYNPTILANQAKTAQNQRKISDFFSSDDYLHREDLKQDFSVSQAASLADIYGSQAIQAASNAQIASLQLFEEKQRAPMVAKQLQADYALTLGNLWKLQQDVQQRYQELGLRKTEISNNYKIAQGNLAVQQGLLKIRQMLAPAEYRSLMAQAAVSWANSRGINLDNRSKEMMVNLQESALPYENGIQLLNLDMYYESMRNISGKLTWQDDKGLTRLLDVGSDKSQRKRYIQGLTTKNVYSNFLDLIGTSLGIGTKAVNFATGVRGLAK